MKAALRIAFGYFDFLPLQRWLTFAGAAMVALGIALTLAAQDPKTSLTMTFFPGLTGAMVMVIMPFSFGGIAMRYASSRSIMHLRPNGRSSMLLGATMAMMLVAVAFTLPILAEYYFLTSRGIKKLSGMQPVPVFFGTWVFMSFAWLILFIASCSRRLMSVMAPAIFAAIFGGRYAVESVAPEVFRTTEPDIRIFVAAALSAWGAFSIWYYRTAAVSSMAWMRDPSRFGSFTLGGENRPAPAAGGDSPARSLRQYLLGDNTSVLTFILHSALPVLMLLGGRMVMPERLRANIDPAFFMFVQAIGPGAIGFVVVRRARCLWLRMGIERPGLFRLVERLCLPTALGMFVVGVIIVLAVAVPGRLHQVPLLLSYSATVGALAVFLFYLGCSLTRGWNAADAILGVSSIALIVAVFVAINPLRRPSLVTVWMVCGLIMLLVLLLRRHALRRWQALDWRIAQLSWRMRGSVV